MGRGGGYVGKMGCEDKCLSVLKSSEGYLLMFEKSEMQLKLSWC